MEADRHKERCFQLDDKEDTRKHKCFGETLSTLKYQIPLSSSAAAAAASPASPASLSSSHEGEWGVGD